MSRAQRLFDTVPGLALRALPLAAMALLAAGTFWMVYLDNPAGTPTLDRQRAHLPDYTINGLSATVLSEQGTTKYRVNADTLTHYEDDETTDIVHPALRAYLEGQPPVTSTADRGKMDADATVLDLYGNAAVVRQAGPDPRALPAISARSEYFQVRINDDEIRTDQAVVLRHGPSEIHAEGMIFNNTTRNVQLKGKVRGTLYPASGAPADGGARP